MIKAHVESIPNVQSEILNILEKNDSKDWLKST